MTLRFWAAQFMASKDDASTDDSAITDAENFDVIVARPRKYAGRAQQMLNTNPGLRLLVYQNATFTWKTNLPESAYSHDASGARINARGWAYTWLINPRDAAAQEWMLEDTANLLQQSGYPDLYLDVCGVAPLVPSYVSGLPANPDTGKTYTFDEWNAAVRDLVAAIRAEQPDRWIAQNSIGNGDAYYTWPTSETVDGSVQAAVAEWWLRAGLDPADKYPTRDSWLRSVNALADLEQRGYMGLPIVTVWNQAATDAQKDAWLVFAAASFLMASNLTSRLLHSRAPGADNMTVWPLASTELGEPRGPYEELQPGVFRRVFDGDLSTFVHVNVTATPAAVELPGWVSLPDGTDKSGTASVPAHAGLILQQT